MAKNAYGLIGRGISHSFSAEYFNNKFSNEGIDACYDLFDIPCIEEINTIIKNNPQLRGLNVTSPYKREVIEFLDILSDEARQLNAVNVVEIIRNNGKITLTGHNTDVMGFGKTLKEHGINSHTINQAMILGTGGASSAVAFALRKEMIPYKIVSRTPKADEIDYEEARHLMSEFELVVNATPVGMYPHQNEKPDLDYMKITPRHIFYDLIYNPAKSLFLQIADKRGAKTINGKEMLLNQAEEAWRIWKNRESIDSNE